MTRTLTLLLALAGVFSTAHAQTGDAQRGSTKVQMCIGCHGIVGYQGDFPQVYHVPRIAGQDAKYISAALTAYRSGDRKHPTMRSIATSLTDQDIADIAAYYSKLGHPDGPVPAALESAVPDKIRSAVTTCVACHGVNFSTPTDGTIPRIAGQYPDYLAIALRSYKVEGNPHYGRSNAVMGAMAKPLKDDTIAEIADYLASLPGELRTVPQAKFK
ncbi:c-type cytochrome [Scleromatobacter humisilvae]|uniref:Cytochrome c4 n=1 Tax=Scleromatobacter humisilvae TaxID=2897159 RepID=A0A9X2BX77_9BURK|nr:c-type cytochrome [Scleromatobacter humisilvae]MCK9684152.1 cytochrome c4 [Scleromatobacter humisilvae]